MPLAVTWIETYSAPYSWYPHTVVPLAGTWIETSSGTLTGVLSSQSFPLRERGLKQDNASDRTDREWSFPLRERGLKRIPEVSVRSLSWSFPLRERGLKQIRLWIKLIQEKVVPLAGTWIETVVSEPSTTRIDVVPLAGTWIETD